MFRRKPVPDPIGDGHRFADKNMRHSTNPEPVPIPKERDRLRPDEHDAVGVWSLACFFIRRDLRRQGIAAQLIEAAVAHACARGATAVEAYPVDPDSPSYRFMGFVDTFCRAGFRDVGRAGKRRHVMRLDLR